MDPRIRIRIHTKMSWIRNTCLEAPTDLIIAGKNLEKDEGASDELGLCAAVEENGVHVLQPTLVHYLLNNMPESKH
jgi:hypothetical protein